MKKDYEVSAYYFPNFHTGDKLNDQFHGKEWSEWNLMKIARPRFEGHEQPKVPLWGYEDEKDPNVMAKKIEAAASHGITNLIFDWYYYDKGIFLNDCLDNGFLKAKNTNDIKFSIMWANHDWLDIHPISRGYLNNQVCELPGKMKKETFMNGIDYIINNYFTKENYFRLEGGLFLSIYEINKFVDTFGGIDNAKEAIKEIRRKVYDKGLGKIHLNAIVWGIRILQGESNKTIDANVLKDIGFDSVMSYVWVHEHSVESFPTQNYSEYREICEKDFSRLTEKFKGMPYYPNVTCGWDASPRTCQADSYEDVGYPFTRILVNNTPKEFEIALRNVKKMLDESELKTKMFTINAFNEWTEGSYLEPDTKDGYGKLEAIKAVFKQRN